MKLVINIFGIALQTMFALQVAVADQFHFYYKDFAYYLYLSFLSIRNFITAVIRFTYNCFYHLYFLERYQLSDYEGMIDIMGSYAIASNHYIEPEGNHIGNMPATRIMGFLNNKTTNPAHLPISAAAMNLMWKVLDNKMDYENTVFIDFGCGVGASMMMAMLQRPLKCIVGVELNSMTAKICSGNIERCLKEQDGALRCKNIVVKNVDMINFRLDATGLNSSLDSSPPLASVILFMYEPLWTISKLDANAIYRKVLRNLKASCSSMNATLYIAYFFAGKFSGDALPALHEMHGELLEMENYPSLFFGADDNMFVYKL